MAARGTLARDVQVAVGALVAGLLLDALRFFVTTHASTRPVAYFIPEHALDPSRPQPGASLWAEVTLPPMGAPRPIRLEMRK